MEEKLLEYRGYRAQFDFSEEDGCFVGTVLGIEDTLAFDGESIEELTESFHTCIDEYLELCHELGKTRDKKIADFISRLFAGIFPHRRISAGKYTA